MGCLRAWLPCCFCCFPDPFKRVKTSFVGLLERNGRYINTLVPGLHRINPLTEDIKLVDLKTRLVDIRPQ